MITTGWLTRHPAARAPRDPAISLEYPTSPSVFKCWESGAAYTVMGPNPRSAGGIFLKIQLGQALPFCLQGTAAYTPGVDAGDVMPSRCWHDGRRRPDGIKWLAHGIPLPNRWLVSILLLNQGAQGDEILLAEAAKIGFNEVPGLLRALLQPGPEVGGINNLPGG